MYPEYLGKLAEQRRESFGRAWIIGENAVYLTTWIIAGALVWPLRWQGLPAATVLWAAIVTVVQILLKKHNCSGCYYYGKQCHLGWGTLSARLFGCDSGSSRTGMRLSLFYILSPPVMAAAAILVGIFMQVTVWHWVLLGIYIALNALTFPLRIRGCGQCAMRNVCPGSAVPDPS